MYREIKFYLKTTIGFLVYLFGGVYFLKMLLKKKRYLIVLNYHNFSRYNNYGIKRGLITETGFEKSFGKQMKFISKHFKFSYLEEFYEMKNEGGVLITFDDGYKDNFDLAFPILKRYNVKAVFFLVTNLIGTEQWLLHDKLRYLVQTGLKSELEIESLLSKLNQGYTLTDWLSKNSEILEKSDVRLMMNWIEVKEIFLNGFKIAPHTHNHEVLSSMDKNSQFKEINDSILKLKKELNVGSNYFAYPNGQYNKCSLEVLQSSKIRYSFTTNPGFNGPEENFLQLKRIGVNASDSVGVLLLKLILKRNK